MFSGSSASLPELVLWSLANYKDKHRHPMQVNTPRSCFNLTTMSSGLPAAFLLVSRPAMILSRLSLSEDLPPLSANSLPCGVAASVLMTLVLASNLSAYSWDRLTPKSRWNFSVSCDLQKSCLWGFFSD